VVHRGVTGNGTGGGGRRGKWKEEQGRGTGGSNHKWKERPEVQWCGTGGWHDGMGVTGTSKGPTAPKKPRAAAHRHPHMNSGNAKGRGRSGGRTTKKRPRAVCRRGQDGNMPHTRNTDTA
jgi:hypothetical protein